MLRVAPCRSGIPVVDSPNVRGRTLTCNAQAFAGSPGGVRPASCQSSNGCDLHRDTIEVQSFQLLHLAWKGGRRTVGAIPLWEHGT